MKDGVYEFWFDALGRARGGALRIHGNLVDGGDTVHTVRGQLARAGTNILASFDIGWRPEARHRPRPGYTMRMFGHGSETDFDLIGIGPLGLIVALRGRWRADD